MGNEHSAFRDVLARTEFFADASAETLDVLADHGEERHLVRGDVLFEEGDPPDALYVVHEPAASPSPSPTRSTAARASWP